jgi:TorA maturation chaperone TorD
MTIAADISRKTGDCFRLLAVFFCEPEKQVWLEEDLCARFTALLAELDLAAAQEAKLLEENLRDIDDQQLRVDYAALFVGPFELVAPPYGSVYLDGARKIMGDSTLQVRRLYRENGLELEAGELPDHIAIELEFLYFLCVLETEAIVAGDTGEQQRAAAVRREFLRRFLAPWTRAFCRAIIQGTDNAFYVSLARCLEGVIEEMRERAATDEMARPMGAGSPAAPQSTLDQQGT